MKKIIQSLFYFLVFSLLDSCIYEPVEKLEMYINNELSEDIEIESFKNGIIDSIIFVPKNSIFLFKKEVGEEVGLIYGDDFLNSDSVIFRTKKSTLTHYSIRITDMTLSGIYPQDNSSFFGNGWKGKVIQEKTKKKGKQTESRFYINNNFFE